MTAHRLLRMSAVGAVLGALALAPAVAHPASADVDDFDYESWDAHYRLSLDDEGRAVLQAREQVVAGFPEVDQNKGIVRGFAERYQGAGLDTTIHSVTDAEGTPVPYELDSEDGLLYVLTGTDEYVHGPTSYVINYRMRDVMLTADDTGGDEFYWDLLPLESSQDIADFRAEIVVEPALAERLTGDVACYRGEHGSDDSCAVDGPEQTPTATVFAVEATDLRAGEGITIAIGFEPGTVVQPPSREPDPLLDAGPGLGALTAGVLAVGGAVAVGADRRRRRRATGIVVAQYDVPASMPPLLAAQFVDAAKDVIPAQILHLAVRGNLLIEDRQDAQPVLHRTDAPVGDQLDAITLTALFGKKGAASRKIPKADERFARRMLRLNGQAAERAARDGLTTKVRTPWAIVLVCLAAVVLAGAIVLVVLSGIGDRGGTGGSIFAVLMAGVLLVLTGIYGLSRHVVPTRAGAEQVEHLAGVREFIRVAEADRIRMLQSYSGAERYTRDGMELLHLYERLLPYAVLFGMEKEWGQVLAQRFDEFGYRPDWFTGYAAGSLASSLSRFGSRTGAAASYVAQSSSSSGSSGGGFSGGGGGGGFSGGR